MSASFDAVIVGGGPAGLASAIVLAEGGCRVLLCDRRPLPADKPCGEGIMPTGLSSLDRLGILGSLRTEHTHPFLGVRYIAPSGRSAQASFAEGAGLGVRRVELSRALLSRVERSRRITVCAPARVTRYRGRHSTLQLAVDGRPVEAQLVVGADGLHSKVRRWSGLTAASKGPKRWGIRRHFAVSPWSEYIDVHFMPGVEAYVTPTGQCQVGVALLWDRERVGSVAGGARLFGDLLRRFPALAARLGGASAHSPASAVGPLRQSTRATVGDGVLLIGDAAGYVDALTGEGVSLALSEAEALAETVAPLLRSRQGAGVTARDLAAHAREVEKITRAYRYMTQLVLLLGRHPGLVEGSVGLLSEQPWLLQRLLSLNMSELSVRSLQAAIRRRFARAAVTAARPHPGDRALHSPIR